MAISVRTGAIVAIIIIGAIVGLHTVFVADASPSSEINDERPHLIAKTAQVSKHDADSILLSFPKSGRTWLRLMMGHALAQQYKIEATEQVLMELNWDLGESLPPGIKPPPRIVVTHEHYGLEHTPHDRWKFPSALEGRRVIYLVRDPRDVLVSDFYDKKYRRGDCEHFKSAFFETHEHKLSYSDGVTKSCFPESYTMKNLLEEPVGGFQTILHYSAWMFEHRKKMAAFMFVRYEDLKTEPEVQLKRIMDFLGVPVQPEYIATAVKRCSFEVMKAKEESGELGRRMKTKFPGIPESHKVREGEVGGFVRHFTGEEQAWMKKRINEVMPKEFGYRTEL